MTPILGHYDLLARRLGKAWGTRCTREFDPYDTKGEAEAEALRQVTEQRDRWQAVESATQFKIERSGPSK